jgi:hypothetical protein
MRSDLKLLRQLYRQKSSTFGDTSPDNEAYFLQLQTDVNSYIKWLQQLPSLEDYENSQEFLRDREHFLAERDKLAREVSHLRRLVAPLIGQRQETEKPGLQSDTFQS